MHAHDMKLHVNYTHRDKHGNVKNSNMANTGMANNSTITLLVHDRDGQETSRREYPFRSFVKSILPFLSTRLNGAPDGSQLVKNVAGDDFMIYGEDAGVFQHGFVNTFGNVSTLNDGIVIGGGDAAVTVDDFKLSNIITSGLVKGFGVVSDIVHESGPQNTYFTMKNTFRNDTDNIINVKEAGLYMKAVSTELGVDTDEPPIMYARDVFDDTIQINTNAIMTVIYKIAFSANEDVGFALNFVKLFRGGMMGDMLEVDADIVVTNLEGDCIEEKAFEYTNTAHPITGKSLDIRGDVLVPAHAITAGVKAYKAQLIKIEGIDYDYAEDGQGDIVSETEVTSAVPNTVAVYNPTKNNISISDTLTSISNTDYDIKFISVNSVGNYILWYHKLPVTMLMSKDDSFSVEFKITIT